MTDHEQDAREIVEEWAGMFDPPPQIDFQQSEALQSLIAEALRVEREVCALEVVRRRDAHKHSSPEWCALAGAAAAIRNRD